MLTIIDRILAYFGYVRADSRVWDERSDLKDTDALARSNRWISFYREEGGIGSAIEGIQHEYFKRAGSLRPDQIEELNALALASRIAGELDAHIKRIIDAGRIEASRKEHADKIAALPELQRRRL